MATLTKHILEISGKTLDMSTVHSCVPVAKAAPSQQVVEQYISNGRYSGDRSEARKRELQSNIIGIRRQIRNMAESYQIDANTRITGITAPQKTVVHCTRIMNQIAHIIG